MDQPLPLNTPPPTNSEHLHAHEFRHPGGGVLIHLTTSRNSHWHNLTHLGSTPVAIHHTTEDIRTETILTDADAASLRNLLSHNHPTRITETAAEFYAHIEKFAPILKHPETYTTQPLKCPTWFTYVGKEQQLINRISSQILEPELIYHTINFLKAATHAGIFGHGWTYQRTITRPDSYTTWWHGALLFNPPHALTTNITNTAALDLQPEPDTSLSAAEFLTQLADLEQAVKRRQASSGDILADLRPQARRIAEQTTLTEPAALYLLAGAPGVVLIPPRDRVVQKMAPEYRKLLKLSGAEAFAAHAQILYFLCHTSLFRDGLDAETAADYWEQQFGKPLIHIDAHIYAYLAKFYQHDAAIELALTEQSEIPEYRTCGYFTVLLHLADQLPGDHAGRTVVADKLADLKATVSEWPTIDTRIPLGDLDALRATGRIHDTYQEQVLRLLTEHHCDELIAFLRHPCATNFHDPAVSAPHLVADVAKTLDLGVDSARYFLQILTLAHPIDANIKKWNNWKKTNLDAAAKPLVERGFLIVGSRKRSGCTRFLPGEWLEARSARGNSDALEAWKRPLYPLWNVDSCAYPMVTGCPPLCPIPKLFEQAWQLYQKP